MSDNASRVVNLTDYGKSRRPFAPAESLPLLHECRDRLIEGAMRTLGRNVEAMENALTTMADRSPLIETRKVYYAAQAILGKQSNELFKACKDAYLASFAAMLGGREQASEPATGELSLIGDEDYEAALAVNKATSRLRFNCAEELVALDARIAALLNRADLSESDNPLGARALTQALFDGIASLGVPQNVQVVLLNQFDLALTGELAHVYQSVNRYLVDHGVLPDIRLGAQARGSAGSRRHDTLAGDAAGDDILKLFEQMAKGFSAPGGQAPASGAGVAGFGLLEALSRAQSGSLILPGGGEFELPPIDAATTRNVVRVLQQSPLMAVASPLDAVMVDAVAMLFDVVFEETSIPDRLKALIARLQIPVLKAAMLDRGFFAHRDHPARRMLDGIASLSVRIAQAPENSPLLDEISALVNGVLKDFDQDPAVFEAACDALDELEARLDAAVNDSLAPDIEKLRQDERLEVAPIVVHDFINRCLAEHGAPRPIQDFLRGPWARLLIADYTREGDAGAHFNTHLETMRELVWSVRPKEDMDARLMLVRILPGLLKRLREGIAETDTSAADAERFFAELVTLHASAVRPAQPALPVDPIADADMPPASAEPTPVAPEQETAGALAEPAPPELAPEVEDEFTLRARNLAKGDWVEFHYDDGTFRWARLGWISAVKNTYLFSDQDGMNTFSISVYRLAEKLRSGDAVIVERKSITESAFSKLLGLFRQKLGSA
jgi:hypothetical protein